MKHGLQVEFARMLSCDEPFVLLVLGWWKAYMSVMYEDSNDFPNQDRLERLVLDERDHVRGMVDRATMLAESAGFPRNAMFGAHVEAFAKAFAERVRGDLHHFSESTADLESALDASVRKDGWLAEVDLFLSKSG